MDIGNRFSLEDFLAYFFPGVTGALGIYLLLQTTPLRTTLPSLSADLTTGIIFFVLSYIVGITLSGFSELVFSRGKSHKDVLPFHSELKTIVLEAFSETFKIPKGAKFEWSREHYYLCRSLVYEHMPSILPLIQRQSSLRQLRINLLPALFIWCAAGLSWGVQQMMVSATAEGLGVVAVSLILFFPIVALTINRARNNEWREVREVLTAFGVGYRKGAFQDQKKAEQPSA